MIKSVAKHSEHLAQCIIDAGALDSLVTCLEEFDPNVKEGAAYALACIAKYRLSLFFLRLPCGTKNKKT